MGKSIVALALAALCAGCAGLDHAGHAGYSVRAFTGKDGRPQCCELHVHDGKEFKARRVQFAVTAEGATLQVEEEEAKAFRGQAISAKAVTVVPINLGDLLK